MKSKVQSRTEYETDIKGNPIKLLDAIKQHAMNYESTQYQMKTISDATKTLFNLKQHDGESIVDYLKRFKAARDVFISHVGREFTFPVLVKDDKDYAAAMEILWSSRSTPEEKAEAQTAVNKICKDKTDQCLAYLHLENTDRSKFGSILSGLDAQCSLGDPQ